MFSVVEKGCNRNEYVKYYGDYLALCDFVMIGLTYFNFIMLRTSSCENENKYHDLRQRSQRILLKLLFSFAVIVFNMMKLLVKTFIMKLFAQINKFRKSINTFLCDFLYSKFDFFRIYLELKVQ